MSKSSSLYPQPRRSLRKLAQEDALKSDDILPETATAPPPPPEAVEQIIKVTPNLNQKDKNNTTKGKPTPSTSSAAATIKKIKEHELLQSTPIASISSHDVIWARCKGGIYWPALFIKPVEGKEGRDSNKVLVQFCEKQMRKGFIPNNGIIRANPGSWEKQVQLFQDLHSATKNKKWKVDAAYQQSLDCTNKFLEVSVDQRPALIDSILATTKGEVEAARKKRASEGPRRVDNVKPLEEPTPPPPPPQVPRHSEKYGLRPTINPPTELQLEGKEKKKPEEVAPNEPSDETPRINRKTGRPYTDGEELGAWVESYYKDLDKTIKFESPRPFKCSKCTQEIDEENHETCHELPFHRQCLTLVSEDSGEEGTKRKRNVYKCEDCLGGVCSLCSSSEPIQNAWDIDPKVNDDPVSKCVRCGGGYHRKCLLESRYGCEIQGSKGPIICPRHFCQVCYIESSRNKNRGIRVGGKQAIRCTECPNTYHKVCTPAGSVPLQNQYIQCPAHCSGTAATHSAKRKLLGCVICFKKIVSAGEGIIACVRCPLIFHQACYGYTDEVKESGVSQDDFCQDYICEFCSVHPHPVFGQVVWYRQPNSTIWPSQIIYPRGLPTTSDPTPDFCITVRYLGPQPSFYQFATSPAMLPFNAKTLEWIKKLGLGVSKPAFESAIQEAILLQRAFEAHQTSIIPEAVPTHKPIEKNMTRVPEALVPKIHGHKEHYTSGQKCSCAKDDPEASCSDNSSCFNRLSFFECSENVCSAGSKCQNRFTGQNKELETKLEVYLAEGGKGWGVRAKEDIKTGDTIAEYLGEVITSQEGMHRITSRKSPVSYILKLDNRCSIDAEYYGNVARFLNHSCSPNCEANIVANIHGKKVALLRAVMDISKGEELTFSYGKSVNFTCNCGAERCVSIYKPTESWNTFCEICGFGGTLILCEHDECSKSYHMECLGLKGTPSGVWICGNHPKNVRRKRNFVATRPKPTIKIRRSSPNIVPTQPTIDKTEEELVTTDAIVVAAPTARDVYEFVEGEEVAEAIPLKALPSPPSHLPPPPSPSLSFVSVVSVSGKRKRKSTLTATTEQDLLPNSGAPTTTRVSKRVKRKSSIMNEKENVNKGL